MYIYRERDIEREGKERERDSMMMDSEPESAVCPQTLAQLTYTWKVTRRKQWVFIKGGVQSEGGAVDWGSIILRNSR